MKVSITYPAYRTLMLAAKYAAPYEIAGLLYGRVDGGIIVEEADVLLIQSVTAASVDAEAREVAYHIAKLSKEQIEKVIGFWHSHGTMSVFHSAIDVQTSEILVRAINPLITLTVNQYGDIKAIIYVYIEKLEQVLSVEAEHELLLGEDSELKKRISKLKKKAKKIHINIQSQ